MTETVDGSATVKNTEIGIQPGARLITEGDREFMESPSKRKDQEASLERDELTPAKIILTEPPQDREYKVVSVGKFQNEAEQDELAELDDVMLTAKYRQVEPVSKVTVPEIIPVSYSKPLVIPEIVKPDPAEDKSIKSTQFHPVSPRQLPIKLKAAVKQETNEPKKLIDEPVLKESNEPGLGQVEDINPVKPARGPTAPLSLRNMLSGASTKPVLLQPRVSLKTVQVPAIPTKPTTGDGWVLGQEPNQPKPVAPEERNNASSWHLSG